MCADGKNWKSCFSLQNGCRNTRWENGGVLTPPTMQGWGQGIPVKSTTWGEARVVALTFHNQLSVVGHTRATVRADHTAVLAHAPLGSVCHTDCRREAPVVDHAGDHEGRVPAIPLLQDRGREGDIILSHTPEWPQHGSSTRPHTPGAHDFP